MVQAPRKITEKEVGFTLTETLVVVGIIAILGALLIPVLTAGKRRGKDLVCINNLSQIGKSMALYALDYDQNLPWAPSEIPVYQAGSQYEDPYYLLPGMTEVLSKYGAEKPIFHCPLDVEYIGPDPVTGEFVSDPTTSFFSRTGSSYMLSGSGPKWLSRLEDDSRTNRLASDAYPIHGEKGPQKGRINVLYRDLHVDTVKWASQE